MSANLARMSVFTAALLTWVDLRARAEALEAPPLITDRPDFTESAASAPVGHLQLELGVVYENSQAGQALDLPQALVRWGVSEGFELRLGSPSLQASWPKREAAGADVGPVELGAKLVFRLGDSAAIGLLPYLTLPLKASQHDTAGAESGSLGAKLVWALDLSERFSLGGNLGVAFHGLWSSSFGQQREVLASLALGIALSEQLGTFLEAFSVTPEDQFSEAPFFVDTGLTWQVTPRIQLDLYLGADVRRLPDAVFAGTGASILW